MTTPILCGVDGIRGGWIVAATDSAGSLMLERADHLGDVLHGIGRDARTIVVDIPIGLTERTPRCADVAARAFLKRKSSSVFASPYVGMLAAATLPLAAARREASRLRQEIEGSTRGCSIQSAALLPKIAEAERAVLPADQRRVREGHPEVTFAVLNGGVAVLSKKSRVVGREERLSLLQPRFGDLRAFVTRGRALGARPDDVLDAFAMLWTAQRVARGAHDLACYPRTPEHVASGKVAQIIA